MAERCLFCGRDVAVNVTRMHSLGWGYLAEHTVRTDEGMLYSCPGSGRNVKYEIEQKRLV